MPRTIRFHLDEHVSPAVAEGLRQHGIEVSTAESAGLGAADDREHCAHSMRSSSIIITFDSDFLVLHAAGINHHGILYVVPSRNRDIGGIIERARLLWEVMEAEEMVGRVEYY